MILTAVGVGNVPGYPWPCNTSHYDDCYRNSAFSGHSCTIENRLLYGEYSDTSWGSGSYICLSCAFLFNKKHLTLSLNVFFRVVRIYVETVQ